MISPSRRIAALLSTFVVAVVATLGLATAPANAVAYRFWSYWQGNTGQWVAASTGPDGYTVVLASPDGTADGTWKPGQP